MKNFKRKNQLFSLCGLNCGLCTMNIGGYCQGCGSQLCQGCKIARCSMGHDNIEYCFECTEYPCDKYDGITEFDSFIVHRNQMTDLAKFQKIGEEKYNQEQLRKREILDFLLLNYNDGRKKNFYSIAANLLDIKDLEEIINNIITKEEIQKLPLKEQISHITKALQSKADEQGIILKLKKKK